MPRPTRSQYATSDDFQLAATAWHVKLHELAEKVDKIVEDKYGITDGGDLCYNLIEMGEIDEDADPEDAARTVAQRIEQA